MTDPPGAHFADGLHQIKQPLIKEIRGKGLMIGMEFFPEAGDVRHYARKMMDAGLLCKETHKHIIRFAPPLVITRNEINWALERIEKVLMS